MIRDLFHGNMLALQIRVLMIVAACLSLAGCGSGGGGNPQPPATQASQPSAPQPDPAGQPTPDSAIERRRRLAQKEIGFFFADIDEMIQTFGWVTFIHIPTIMFDWGAQSYGFNLMRAARDAGHMRFVVTLGEFGFRQVGRDRVYLGADVTRAKLRGFMAVLKDEGFLDNVIAFVPPDEPNLNDGDHAPISDADLNAFCDDVEAVCPEFFGKSLPMPLWCIYAGQNDDRPAIGRFAVVFEDNYGKGTGVIADSAALPVHDEQEYGLVPQVVTMDGRGPEWPQAWVDAAIASTRCRVLWLFDYVGGPNAIGLRSADTDVQKAWMDAGYEIVAAHEAHPTENA